MKGMCLNGTHPHVPGCGRTFRIVFAKLSVGLDAVNVTKVLLGVGG